MQDNIVKLRDGRNLGFSDYGQPEGIPLLLFHGTPGSRISNGLENASWIEQFGIRVITPERPGFGLSDPAPGRKISDWATDVDELADYLGLDRFHVAGGSGGGPYALACAIHSPARVLSATLFSSGVPPEVMQLSKDMQSGNRIGFFLAKNAPFLLKTLLKVLLPIQARSIRKHPEKFIQKMLSKMAEWDRRLIENQKSKEGLAMHVNEAFRQGSDGAYRDMLLVSRSWRLDLDEIAVPVFMWHGTADTMMPISLAREFSRLIPGCEPHFIPDAGHLLLASEEVRSQIIARILSVSA
ncbi:MAG: alpha/beta fold hydrolase [Gammaproteobacteria bacterium]